MGLTTKQRVFVEEYLRCFNATEAARRAGYAHPNKRGPENVAKSGIREFIDARLNELTMQPAEILLRLTTQARGSLDDFFDVDTETGFAHLNMVKAKKLNQMGVIKKIKILKGNRIEIELHDPQAALEKLGRAYGLFKDGVVHSGEVTVTHDHRTDVLSRLRGIADAGPATGVREQSNGRSGNGAQV